MTTLLFRKYHVLKIRTVVLKEAGKKYPGALMKPPRGPHE
jgi:hypothetical protein